MFPTIIHCGVYFTSCDLYGILSPSPSKEATWHNPLETEAMCLLFFDVNTKFTPHSVYRLVKEAWLETSCDFFRRSYYLKHLYQPFDRHNVPNTQRAIMLDMMCEGNEYVRIYES